MTSILADRQYTLNDYKHQEQLHISNELLRGLALLHIKKLLYLKEIIIINQKILKKKILHLQIGKLSEILRPLN